MDQRLPQKMASNHRSSVIVRAQDDTSYSNTWQESPQHHPHHQHHHPGQYPGYPGSFGGINNSPLPPRPPLYLPGRNDDRLTHSSFPAPYHYPQSREPADLHGQYQVQHQPVEYCQHDQQELPEPISLTPDSLDDISYAELEQRLAQPSQMFRQPKPSLNLEEPADLNIDIDDIFQKFSDLVKGNTRNKSNENNNMKTVKQEEHFITENEEDEDCYIKQTASFDNPNDDHDEDDKNKDDKRPVSDCHVCGDRAIAHLHYGGICCYSCKAFFRRAVQSGKDKSYKCKHDSNCEVSVNTRRGCQKCRFEKCKSIGMTASWVLSDEQCEIRFGKGKGSGGKRKLFKDEDDANGESEEPPDKQMSFDKIKYSENDKEMIDHMVKVYNESWEQLCFSEKNARLVQEILGSKKEKYSAAEMNSMVTTVIQRGIFAMNNNHHFRQLGEGDKKQLLVSNMTEMCLIRGALRFNAATSSFSIDLKGGDKPANDDININAEIRQDSLKNLYASEDITRYVDKAVTSFLRDRPQIHTL